MRTALLFLVLFGSTNPAFANEPVTDQPWQEAVISVRNLDNMVSFFTDIGGYEIKWSGNASSDELAFYGLPEGASADAVLLGPANVDGPLVRLLRFHDAGPWEPMRPGAHAWDTGCYFSLMIRMKDIERIYGRALDLGWLTETPIAPLSFGTSELRIVIFKGPHGVQIQGYERLSPPLPDSIPEFDHMSPPFNIMQMVRDRDVAYDFFTDILGFDTFFLGKPYTDTKPTPMPLGIPLNITDSSRYRAGIVYPEPGEFGRMEMIELMDLKGFDFSDRCQAPNTGLLSVRYPVTDAESTAVTVTTRGGQIAAPVQEITVQPYGKLKAMSVDSPDGARIEFFETVQP